MPGRGRGWGPDRWLVTQAYQRHLLQVQLTDRLLGALIERLKAAGIYDRSLLVVTADHGISFVPSLAKRWMSEETAGGVAAVPLFVRQPSQSRAVISDLPVEAIDVLPTIADALDLSSVWSDLDGRSALDGSIPPDRIRSVEGVRLDAGGVEKFAAVDQKYAFFDAAGETLDPFRLGPGDSEALLGRQVADLTVSTPDELVTARVPNLADYERAQPDEPVFPALLEGALEELDTRGRRVVAVAVNGRIAAVTRTYEEGGAIRFYSMLPPSSFGYGPDTIELFLVNDASTGSVSPLPVEEA
jgi:hypothetical protein